MAKPDTLKRVLHDHHLGAEIIDKINGDFEDVTDKSTKKKKANYLFHAAGVMDSLLDEETRRKIMESCACSIGSSVERKSERFAEKTRGFPFEEKVRLLCDQAFRQPRFAAGRNNTYPFRCRGRWRIPLSLPANQRNRNRRAPVVTYCLCCCGHYRYQYEKALGVKLDIKQLSSPLESEGQKPCAFVLTRIDGEGKAKE